MTDTQASEALTFKALDGIGLAAIHARLDRLSGKTYHFQDLGPWLERQQLNLAGHDFAAGPRFVAPPPVEPLAHALEADTPHAMSPIDGAFVLRPMLQRLTTETLSPLGLVTPKCDVICGIPRERLRRITGALVEVFDNVFEHSDAAPTGLAAFYAQPGAFEFCVSDQGIGVFEGLRRVPAYAALASHAAALERAIQPGVSRHVDDRDRGHGFDQLVTGMANLNAEIRLRSGDAILQISAVGQNQPRTTIAQNVNVNGVIVSAKFFALRPGQSVAER